MESERGPVSGTDAAAVMGLQETPQFAAQTPKPGTTVARVARRYDVKRITGLAFRVGDRSPRVAGFLPRVLPVRDSGRVDMILAGLQYIDPAAQG